MLIPFLSTIGLKLKVSLTLAGLIVAGFFTTAQSKSVKITDPSPIVMKWKVGDTIREALVYIPVTAKTKPTPIIFAFHGHGGTMERMYTTREFEKLWPEAITICPQGLNTVGQLTDKEGQRTGWETKDKSAANRDLVFFDAMLKTLTKDYKIDLNRIYVTGHSNGGSFTYFLWALRGPVFAAVAPTAAAAIALTLAKQLMPKPALHLMGEKDPLVKPEWQKLTYNAVLKLNKCNAAGEKLNNYATLYPSATNNPVILFIHPGGHEYPNLANETIIDFFKKQVKH